MQRRFHLTSLFQAILLALLANLYPVFLSAQDGSITLSGSRVQLVVQERVRASGSDLRSTADEFARINLVFNTLENYLLYLEKLDRIAPMTKMSLEYAPEGSTRDRPADRWVIFDELLFNSLLSKVNAFLAEKPGTRRNDLVQERSALRNIRDQLPRRDDVVENSYRWKNFSDFAPAIEPDVDFAVLQENRVAGLRPTDVGYTVVRLDASESAGIELATFSEPVFDLTPSPDGAWLGLTVKGRPALLNTINRGLVSLFPGQRKVLLDMAWAPFGNLLAGIVLNQDDGEREIFLYDAENSKHLSLQLKEKGVEGNYQYAFPSWSPDGSRLLFTSGNDLSLIEVKTGKIFAGIFPTPNLITQVLWSPDSLSFAFVEVLGQSRNKTEFDDRDFRGSILHRFRTSDQGSPFEETSQRYLSAQTLKLVSFWTQDRLLFLEGRLKQQKVHSSFWDLSSSFAARLTPPPSLAAQVATSPEGVTIGGLEMRLDYCFVYRHLDSRFRNVYDAGLGGTNFLFSDRMANTWFLGIKPPEGFPRRLDTFSLRPQPYPFGERNICFLSSLSKDICQAMLEFLTSYNLRRVEFNREGTMLFLLSNSRGPLSIWGGEIANFSSGVMKFPQKSLYEEAPLVEDSDKTSSEGAVITGPNEEFVLPPPPPPPPMDPGIKLMESDKKAKPPVTQKPGIGEGNDEFTLPPPPPLPGLEIEQTPKKPKPDPGQSQKEPAEAAGSEQQTGGKSSFVLPPVPSLPGFEGK